ncbi:MAG TPA: response regulator transcription factor [Blastocatellia bacterium]|jgi:DNA-binding NarL/FixJ family response regulator|nr:response regulator transcription factor [Blastocatellia bacterium]
MAEITILIADDHPIFRKGLRQIVESESGLKVVGEADDGESAYEKARQLKPALIILDVNMPGMDGFDVARKIHDSGLAVEVVFLTMYKDEDMFNAALDLKAKGYVLKSSALTDIVDCVRTVSSGQHYISPALSDFLLNRRDRASRFVKSKPSIRDLTPTELRIVRLIADAKTSKEIAAELFISYRTVENHRANICQKLDLHGSNALVKFAIEHKSTL